MAAAQLPGYERFPRSWVAKLVLAPATSQLKFHGDSWALFPSGFPVMSFHGKVPGNVQVLKTQEQLQLLVPSEVFSYLYQVGKWCLRTL